MRAAGPVEGHVSTTQPRWAVVLLAAGRSERFGTTKLVTLVDGDPLIRVVAERLLTARPAELLVVLGHDADRVRSALDDLPLRFVTNPEYASGMGTSIAFGIRALEAHTAAAMIALGDQPLPERDVPRRLLEAFAAGVGPIVAPVYAGVRGNPVVFDRSVFPELMRLEGDEGARGLLARSPGLVATVDFPFPPPPDVDTPADLAWLR